MEFDVKMELDYHVDYWFKNGKYDTHESDEDEPATVIGTISIEDKKIGCFLGYELYNDRNFYITCDDFSADLESIASVICDESGKVSEKYLTDEADYEKIFILDHIEINKKYRNKGIGSDIIKNLSRMLHYQFDYGSNIFLCASDFESAKEYGFDSNEYKEGCQRLIKFYKKFGYKVISNKIMVYNEPKKKRNKHKGVDGV